jgi:hypothetical protein
MVHVSKGNGLTLPDGRPFNKWELAGGSSAGFAGAGADRSGSAFQIPGAFTPLAAHCGMPVGEDAQVARREKHNEQGGEKQKIAHGVQAASPKT